MKVLTASAALGLAAAAVAGGNGDRREGRPLLGKPTYDPECDEGVTKIILRQFSRYEDLVYGLCLQMFDIDYDTVLRKTKITTTVSGTRTVTFTSVVPVTATASATVTTTTTTATTSVVTYTPILKGGLSRRGPKKSVSEIIEAARLAAVPELSELRLAAGYDDDCDDEKKCQSNEEVVKEIVDACRCLINSRPLPTKKRTRTIRKTAFLTKTTTATVTTSSTTSSTSTLTSSATATTTTVSDVCGADPPGYLSYQTPADYNPGGNPPGRYELVPRRDVGLSGRKCCQACQITPGCTFFVVTTGAGAICNLAVQKTASLNTLCPVAGGPVSISFIPGPNGAFGVGPCGVLAT